MKDKLFDDILKSKLLSLRIDPDTDTKWDVLNQKVNEELGDSAFDVTISSKLSQLSQTVPVSDWDSFSEILQHSDDFDSTVKTKLDSIKGTKVSEHWLVLQDKLMHILYLKENILKLKIVESILGVGLLLLFVATVPYMQQNQDDIAQLDTVADYQSSISSINLDKQEIVSENPTLQSSTITVNSGEASENTGLNNNEASDIAIKNTAPAQVESYESVTISHRVVTGSVSEELVQTPTLINSGSLNISATETSTPIASINALDRSDRAYLELNDLVVSLPTVELEMQAPLANGLLSKSNIAIHTTIGLDVDVVSTPGDDEFVAYNHLAIGSNIGGRLSYDVGRLSLETGLSILNKGYKPDYLNGDDARQEILFQTLEAIDFKMVSIPVMAKYQVLSISQNDVYGIAGLQYSNLSAETYHETQFDTSNGGSAYLENKAIASDLLSDHIVHYSLGAGVSRPVSKDISVYGQLLYTSQLSTSGIGINQDVFNSTNFQFGVKYYPFR
jgi:hypothetical protein